MNLKFPKGSVELASPQVMGVLNVTPDSFSDGGKFVARDDALRQAELMVKEGATFIDVGGESTRPGAAEVSETEELDRVCPVVEAISGRLDIIVSLDTSNARVMREGVSLGAQMINDVRALTGDGAVQAVVALDVPVCLMHMQGVPPTMQENPSYTNAVREVVDFFENRLAELMSAGVVREHVLIDPGFGFGKRLEDNLQLLRSLTEFRVLNLPVLVGLSRKSMLGALTGRVVDERLAASLAAAAIAVYNGAHIVRAHDVAATVDAIKVAAEVREAKYE